MGKKALVTQVWRSDLIPRIHGNVKGEDWLQQTVLWPLLVKLHAHVRTHKWYHFFSVKVDKDSKWASFLPSHLFLSDQCTLKDLAVIIIPSEISLQTYTKDHLKSRKPNNINISDVCKLERLSVGGSSVPSQMPNGLSFWSMGIATSAPNHHGNYNNEYL